EWVDPIVGVNLSVPFSKRISAGVLADIGGFGAGSDLAWEVMPVIGFPLKRHDHAQGRVPMAGRRLRQGRFPL
ncbi:MAG TPA: hypothetical protein P5520_09740, partial [Desulfomonilia bacterium]|nr:hypothetical protein [Desulfomonilia bacterium]